MKIQGRALKYLMFYGIIIVYNRGLRVGYCLRFMVLSLLQKYILLSCLNAKNFRINRDKFSIFYDKQRKKPQNELQTKIITQSLERLINRELLIGYGIRTSHKWFIKEVRLTAKGKKEAKKLLGEQRKLPFKKFKLLKNKAKN